MNPIKIMIAAYSRQGIRTALKAAEHFSGEEIRIFAAGRLLESDASDNAPFPVQAIPPESRTFYGELFSGADLLIFVGALGIAVRNIAPFVKDKCTDPAVLCIDEQGTFVISVLSGHIGGANRFAAKLADALGAVAVITTATDLRHRFSVDSWAAANGLIIDDMKAAKAVSAAILEGEVPLESDLPVLTDYPPGVRKAEDGKVPEKGPGILVSWLIRQPFPTTLRLIPCCLHLGIGCRKGISKEAVADAVEKVLREHRLDPRAVKGVYSIDLKKDEPGLTAYCSEQGWPFQVYTAQELNQVEGTSGASAFVKSVTGTDNVCERAALKDADRLIVPKTVESGVTVAAAVELSGIRFD